MENVYKYFHLNMKKILFWIVKIILGNILTNKLFFFVACFFIDT